MYNISNLTTFEYVHGKLARYYAHKLSVVIKMHGVQSTKYVLLPVCPYIVSMPSCGSSICLYSTTKRIIFNSIAIS